MSVNLKGFDNMIKYNTSAIPVAQMFEHQTFALKPPDLDFQQAEAFLRPFGLTVSMNE